MNSITKANYAKLITALIEELPQREQLILSLVYVEGLTLKEVARVLSSTEEGIQQAYVKALNTCIGPVHSRVARRN